MSSPSLHAVVDDPGERTAPELLEAHRAQLAAVLEAVGIADAVEATDAGRDRLAAIAAGDADAAGELDLGAAAAVLALADGAPAPSALVDEALESLLFGMTAGVLDVDVVAGEVEADLEPREVQGMLEGRHPVSLREFVALQRVIAGRAF